MQKCLLMLLLIDPSLDVMPVQRIARGAPLPKVRSGDSVEPLLLVANPHGLHARYLLEGSECGFRLMITDKPACVSLKEVAELQTIPGVVAVCHGYRLLWGPQEIKRRLDTGDLGDLVAIEGRYWQSSAAQKALEGSVKTSWKNDPSLNGDHDVLVDLGSHWTDLVFYLMNAVAENTRVWLSYANAEAPHRDTHAQVTMAFSGGRRALGSLSKTFHGMGNHFEIQVLGKRGAAGWAFEAPDELAISRGRETVIHRRAQSDLGSHQAPFHGLGWLEGYLEVIHRAIRRSADPKSAPFPELREHLAVMQALLTAEQA